MTVFGSPVSMSRPRTSACTSSRMRKAEPTSSLISSAVCWPISSLYSFLTWLMIASSISSPPTRRLCETTMPPSEMTATSVVPPPMSTIMFPVGSETGRPAPIAAAIGSSIRYAWRAPAESVASSTARFSTPVTPDGHADDDARVREAVLVHLLDEVAEHLLGHVEVGDDAVLQRPDRGDRARRAAEHPLGLDADRVDLARALVDRDHRRLGEHDAAAAHVDERVGGAEIDGHVAAAEAVQVVKRPHESRRV